MNQNRIERHLSRVVYLALVLLVLIFILYPLVSITLFSFRGPDGISLQYYRELVSPRGVRLIIDSMRVALPSSIIAVTYALFICLYGYSGSERRRRWLDRFSMISLISPPFVSALAFIVLFGRRGLITHDILGLDMNPYGPVAIVLLQTIGGIAFSSILLSGRFRELDTDQILAARDLGAGPLVVLTRIILPGLWPGLVSAFFLQFTMNLADFSSPIVVGGGYRVIASEAYLTAVSSSHLGRASALSVVTLPIALLAFFYYFRMMRSGEKDTRTRTEVPERLLRMPKWLEVFFGLFTYTYITVILLKYGNIVLSAFSRRTPEGLRFSLAMFGELQASALKSLMHSLLFALAAGIVSSFIGVLLAYYTHRRKVPLGGAVEFITSLPYIIPGTFFGLGYVAAFSSKPLYLRGTFAILLANYIFRQLSVSFKASAASFQTVGKNVDEAARDLGAGPLRIFFHVLLPGLRSVLMSSFVTVFTASMTAVGAIAFIISPGMSVASMEIFRSVESGRYGVASLQALFMLVAIIIVNLIVMALLRKEEHRVRSD